MKIKYCLPLFLTLLLSTNALAQLNVNSNTFTTNQLVQDILVGQGVEITNVTFSGNPIQRGYFDGSSSNIGISAGVILATGNIFVARGPNNFQDATQPVNSGCGVPNGIPVGPGGLCRPGDSDLDNILPSSTSTFDAAVLEFDFTPQSDTVRFNYVFGSEEYPEFVCSDFNDVFAFLLSGPNPSGGNYNKLNIARIPNTTIPVAINTINSGVPGQGYFPSGCSGPAGSLNFDNYYTNNIGGGTVQFDGFTKKLQAVARVIPCETYHIKIAIADAGDGIYDSAVFLEANSFAADAVEIEVVTVDADNNVNAGGDTVAEGCDDFAEVTFSLAEAVPVDYTIPVTISGTAINGTDYETLPGSIFIPAEQNEVTIILRPITDAITEGSETVVFEVQTSVCQTETITLTIGEEMLLPPPAPDCNETTASAINFAWDPVPGATGYEVSLDGGTTWISPNPGPLSHTVNGLSQGDVVDILVRALGGVLYCNDNPSSQQTCIAVNCTVNAEITSQTNPICNGGNDGSATATLIGGEAPLTFQWSGNAGNQTTATATGLSAGLYAVTVTDAFSCPSVELVQIMDPPAIQLVDISPTQPSCNGSSNGSITVTANGGTGTLNYQWSNGGGNAPTISNIPAGTYTVTVTDDNGCEFTEQIVLPDNDALALDVAIDTPLCNGDTNGSATVTASNGVGQLDVMWSDGQNTGTAINLSAGTYSVTVVDEIGCDGTTDFVVNEPDELTVNSLTQNNITCNGENDGSAEIIPAGGTMPYTYLWQPGTQITPLASNLTAGIYTVTVTDDNGCIVTAEVQITEPDPIVISDVATIEVSCPNVNDGQITITATGGAGTIQYSVDNGNTFQNSNIFQNLPIGAYDIVVQDGNGCSTSSNVDLTAPDALVITDITGGLSDCTGSGSGSASVTAEGGVPPYDYLWSTGQNTPSISNIGVGIYAVSVTDDNDCQVTASIEIFEPSSIEITNITMTPVRCNGDSTGTATVEATGVGTLSYLWMPGGQTTATATGLAPGNYTIVVTGEDDCMVEGQIEVTEPSPLTINSLTGTDIICNGANDGTATVIPAGGTPSYTYQWQQSGVFGENPTGLSPGTYTVNVLDAGGCTVSESIVINEPDALVIDDIIGTDISCGGDTDGTASASASGGIGTLTYTWMPSGQTGQNVDNLLAGVQTLTVTDGNGCTITSSVELFEPQPLVIDDISSDMAACNGENTGNASVSVSGGTGAYTYSWQPSLQNTPVANNLPQGNYTINITDERGCSITANIDVTEPEPLTATTSGTLPTCNGLADGTASVEGTGGTAPYTYQWDANAFNQTTATVTGLSAGNYAVTVTDDNDCIFITQVEVPQPEVIALEAEITPVNCINGNDGEVTIIATGGSGVYTYEWDAAAGNQTTATASNLTAGNYTVNVFDSNDCFETMTLTVDQPATAITASGVDAQVSCAGDADGSASVIPAGGTGAFSFQWSSNTGSQTTQTATDLGVGDYTVTVSDINGCTATASANISEPTALDITATNENNGCAGSASGEASATASGGTPNASGNYTYEWSNGQVGPIAIDLPDGTYSVTATDLNGCTATASVDISAPPELTADITGTGANCFGDANGSASVSATGGIPPYTYQWSPNAGGATTPNLDSIPMGTYEVIVTDQNGCTTQVEIMIGQNLDLTLDLSSTPTDCPNSFNGTATVTPNGGLTPYTYLWNDSNAQTTPTASNLGAAHYFVTVTDANGCVQLDSVRVEGPTQPFSFTAATTDVDCFGDTDGQAILTTTGGTPFYEYSIDGGTTWIQSPVFVGLGAGDYSIIVRDLRGCTFEDIVTIYEPSEFAVDAGEDVTIEIGDSVQLQAGMGSPADIYTYNWSTFDTAQPSCTDCFDPWVQPVTTSTYEVLATNEFGCTDTDEVIVYVDTERSVFIANAFTPNGDGANDFFYVQGDDKLEKVVVFRVFDRWGEVVYEQFDVEANNPEFGWDGTMKGQDMNPSVFVWYAEVEFSDGYSEVYQGDVSLIR